jgi:ABC-type transport system substrate-binding protein
MASAIEGYWLDPQGSQIDPNVAKFFKYDPQGAKQLLSAAGFANGFEAKLHYTNIYSASYNLGTELASEYLSKIGVKLTLNVDDYAGYYQPVTQKGNFDGLAYTSYGVFIEPVEYLTQVYLPNATRNYSKVNDPDLAARVQKIAADPDSESRRKAILDIQNYLGQKMYYVPLVIGGGPVFNVFQPYMRGVLDYRTINGYPLNVTNFSVDKA